MFWRGDSYTGKNLFFIKCTSPFCLIAFKYCLCLFIWVVDNAYFFQSRSSKNNHLFFYLLLPSAACVRPLLLRYCIWKILFKQRDTIFRCCFCQERLAWDRCYCVTAYGKFFVYNVIQFLGVDRIQRRSSTGLPKQQQSVNSKLFITLMG